MIEVKNAIIDYTMLGFERGCLFSFSLGLDYGVSGQVAGGYCLDTPVKDKDNKFLFRTGSALGTNLIMKILNIVGVEKWEDLKGSYIRVKASPTKVHEIGNLLKDEWLNFEDFFNEGI